MNKNKIDTSWSKGWDNVNLDLYTKIVLARTESTSLIRYNEEHLAKVLKVRHDLDKKH